MKPATFDFVRALTIEEALEALAEAGEDALVLAGGQSLLPMLNMRLARPRMLVDIMRISELQRAKKRDEQIVIGAAVRQHEIETDRQLLGLRLLRLVLPWVGHVQTRSRGTICGSIAHADPSAELPLVLVALQGEIHLRSRRQRRRVAAESFFTGMMTTQRRPDEMIEAVSLPTDRPGAGYSFREIGRRHGDFAIVACAAVVEAGGARLAVGGVADHPVARAMPLSQAGTALDDALNEFAWSLGARDDLHATARYRRELVRRLGRATIEEAERCRG